MASFFLAVLLLVLLWWALHQREYLKGNVDRPFFSWGRPQKPVAPSAPPPSAPEPIQYQRKRPRRKPAPKPPTTTQAQGGSADELEVALHTIATYTHNRDVAVRLLREALEENPGQPMKYCVARALEKLMRDRRA